jgi:hypothetical protein
MKAFFLYFSTVSAIYVIIKHGKDNSQSQIFVRLNDVPLLRCSRFFFGEKLIHIEKLFLCVSRSRGTNCCVFYQLFASSGCSLLVEESQVGHPVELVMD